MTDAAASTTPSSGAVEQHRYHADNEDAQPHGPEQPQFKPIIAASLILVLFQGHVEA
jgi:hypothetical protein